MNRTGSKILHGMLLATSALVGSPVIVSTAAMANPTGGTVAVGSATITNPSATKTVITQSSNKALINWNSFSVSAGSTVQFNQPGTSSLTVNRVTGPSSSVIDGQIIANGNVWLLNANGILFGKGSQINVNTLLATTSDLSDSDFQAGNNNFTPSPNPNASVVNQGTITAARGGSVVLSAPRVSNEGLIQADLGTVVLGGAQAFTVDMTGDNLLRYQITVPVSDAPKDAQGNTASALVSNSGTIAAAGGHVLMTARAARNVEDDVINNTGMVEATSVSSHDGEIDLDAGPNGTTNAGGTLDASGTAKGQTGGTVNVTGGTVNVADGAKIDASGSAGGGTIRIGGGLHGGGTLAHAQHTIIGAATITADAINKGNGGTVAVWSDGTTQFNGSISARGGANGGNGGYVETSGHDLGVASSAKVNMGASLGLSGDWLLDPNTIYITSGGGDGVGSTNSTAFISPTAISNALGSGDVTLEAATANGTAGQINVCSTVSYTSCHTLSLLSTGNIAVSAGIQNAGNGAVNLIAGWNGTAGLGHLTDTGAYGVGGANATITINNGSIGSAAGTTTLAGGVLRMGNGSGGAQQIGYNGTGTGDINVLTTSGITLDSENAGSVLIGNGYLSGSGATAVSGDINIDSGSQVTFTQGNGTIAIGNSGGTSQAGNLTFVAGGVNETGGTPFENSYLTDIQHGDVTLGFTQSDFTFDAMTGNAFNNSNSLTILSAKDIYIESSLTNGGGGNITLVGGWDGHTTTPSLLTGPSVYGVGNQGNITVSFSGGEGGNVFVGSASGAVLVEGFKVTVAADGGYAQIGYTGGIGTGDITVAAKYAVMVTASDGDGCNYCYAQIGNGGDRQSGDGNQSGNVSVTALGDVTLTAGADDFSYAQIGNGGDSSAGNDSGNVNVKAANVVLNGSTDYAQIGNGGWGVIGNATGGITVNATGNISLTSGEGGFGSAQIGNGGQHAIGNDSGNINITAVQNIVLTATSDGQYVQIGNGVDQESHGGSGSGNIILNAGNLTLNGASSVQYDEGSTVNDDYAGIGNTGVLNSSIAGSGNASGSISIAVNGLTTVNTTSGEGDAWIGNYTVNGTASGAVSIITGDLSDSADYNGDTVQFVGHDLSGGAFTLGYTNATDQVGLGGLDYSSSNALTILTAGDMYVIGDVQNSGTGNITLVAGWNPSVTPSNVSAAASGAYGNNNANLTVGGVHASGSAAVGSAGGTTTILTDNLIVSSVDGTTQIGYNGAGGGAINVVALGNILEQAEVGNNIVQIGNGGYGVTGAVGGNISVRAGGNITVEADAQSSSADIGNIGGDGSSQSGNITVNATGRLFLNSNNTSTSAQIGNLEVDTATPTSLGNATGNINITAASTVMSAMYGFASAQIGNGNTQAYNGNVTGNIALNTGNLTLTTNGTAGQNGSPSSSSIARIGGHGAGTENSNITINATGNILLTAGTVGNAIIGEGSQFGPAAGNLNVTAAGIIDLEATGLYAQARIGNGGFTGATGNLTVNAAKTITLDAAGQDASAAITNFGNGTVGGNIAVTSTGGNVVLKGTGTGSFAGIGLGSTGSAAIVNGNIAVTASGNATNAGTIELDATNSNSGAQIGNGEGGNDSSVAGNIMLVASKAITLNATAAGSDALIGSNGLQNISGTINVTAGGAFDLENGSGGAALIGNAATTAGSASGNVTATAQSIDGIGDSIFGDLPGGDFTINELGTHVLTIDNGATYSSTHALSINTGGNILIEDSIQNAGTGNITLVSNGDIIIGGSGATGGVAVGTQGGATNIVADDLLLTAANGYAQLGYHGAGTGLVSANISGNVTLTGGSNATLQAQIGDGATFAPANGGSVVLTAGEIGATGAAGVAGNSAGIIVTGIGGVGTASDPLAVAVNDLAIQTNGAGAYIVSPTQGLSIGVGGNGINLGTTGTFVLAADGAVTQTAAIHAGALSVTTTNGSIALTNTGNAFNTATLSTSGTDSASLTDASNLTITSATIGGNLTLVGGGGIGQSGAITADALSVTTTDGVIALTNTGNAFNAATLSTSGTDSASLYDASDLTIAGATIGGDLTLTGGGSIGQSGAITANTLNVTTANGGIALTNASNAFNNATLSTSGTDDASLTDTSDLTIAGATVGGNLTLTGGGSIGQSGAITADALSVTTTNGGIVLTNSGNAFNTATLATSGTDSASLYDASDLTIAVATIGGDLTLTGGGSIGQSGAITANALSVTTTDGGIALTNSGNAFNTASLSTSGTDSASLTDASDLTIAGATIGGNLTLASGGSIDQTGAIHTNVLDVSSTGGAIVLNNTGNAISAVKLATSGSGSALLTDSGDLTVDGAAVGGDLTLVTTGDLAFVSSVQLDTGSILAVAGWNGSTVGTPVSNGNGTIVIGGSDASGGVAIGSKSGKTTLESGDLLLAATNGYAQIGYQGGGSGDILVNVTGDIVFNGGTQAAYFAQIGDGGYDVSGSNNGAVTVLANGNITLNAGSGSEAYAQIGNGGAQSNSGSSGYTDTGLITVGGENIELAAGSGAGSYAQIGDGGYKSGQSLNGTAVIGDNILVNAVNAVTLTGNGADAYAQIGNGGDFVNNGAANGSGGTIAGDVTVKVSAPQPAGNAIAMTAGGGANSYVQIGNGGNGENTPASGAAVNFNVSGNISINDLALIGSNTGANAYAQIGNGDAAKTGTGNISGNIVISSGTDFTVTAGTAPGASAGIQNGTGTGTIGGTVAGYTPSGTTTPVSDPTTIGSVSTIVQNPVTPTAFTITQVSVTPEVFSQPSGSAEGGVSNTQTPLEKMSGSNGDPDSEGEQVSDGVEKSVGQSLGGGKTYVTTRTLIPGVLKQIVTLTPGNPHGVPPADEDYSSWGNEALWRW